MPSVTVDGGASGANDPRTLVLLCADLDGLANGIDLDAVAARLSEAGPGLAVEIEPSLCSRPEAIARAEAVKADRAVLGLCGGRRPELETERAVREAGLDPLALEVVDLGGHAARAHSRPVATDRAVLLLLGAAARSRAHRAGVAGNTVPRFARMEEQVSRRGLLGFAATLPPVHHQAVAVLYTDSCAADGGCDLCVGVCPAGALAVDEGALSVDRARCEACGLCVVECPRGALSLATASPAQLGAEIGALLGLDAAAEPPAEPHAEPGAVTPRALLFRCERGPDVMADLAAEGTGYPAAWLPVRVACTGAVTAARVLGAIAAGAAVVGVSECAEGCTFGQQERVAATVDYCRQLLALLGRPPDLVRLVPAAAEQAAAVLEMPPQDGEWSAREPEGGFGPLPRTAAEAVLALAEASGARSELSLQHERSPLGVVRVDAGSCTACGSCARACPAEALLFEEGEESATLTFDPARCTACGLCAGRCPENVAGAVSVERVTDLAVLRRGSVVLFEDRTVHCEVCGTSIGPAAMVGRVEALLQGTMNEATLRAIGHRCMQCRALGNIGAPPLPSPRPPGA